MHTAKTLILLSLILSLSLSGLTSGQAQDPIPSSVSTYELDPQFAVDWIALLYDRILAEGVSAPAAARLYAYAGITLYEGVYHGMASYYPLANSLDSMPDLPLPELDRVYDWATVANQAMFVVLSALMKNESGVNAETTAAFANLNRQQISARKGEGVTAEVVANSVDYGDILAAALLEWANEDNYLSTRGREFTLPTGNEMYWVPTDEGGAILEPYWGQIRPFAMDYAGECDVYPNIYFSTDPASAFYAQAEEVRQVGNRLTPEQAETARYWIDSPYQTGTPAGHWILIGNQLVDQLDLTLDRAAIMYALLGMAVGDSFISAWNLKYQVLMLRPVTYINRYLRRSWRPLVETPPFPEYPSGHSVVSAAASEVLTGLFGVVAFTDRTHVERGLRERSYTSFQAAASEAAISRLYGGIHYRFGIENGLEQGECIGELINARIRYQPIFQGE
jgi:membrane-associated phospholipid phosphatase